MSYTPKIKITAASYHRNGISGEGFHAILFTDAEEGQMIASLFDADGCCAVFSLAGLSDGNIAFAQGNSWRGDVYADVLKPLLIKWEAKHGSNQMGPFALPDTPNEQS